MQLSGARWAEPAESGSRSRVVGDADAAFKAFEQARLAGDMWLTQKNPDLIFEPLRCHARWKQLLNRMSIPVAAS